MPRIKPDRIEVLNPNTGRPDRTIAADRYTNMKKAILKVVPRRKAGVPFAELSTRVAPLLDPNVFEGASIGWYTTTVKLDLEARGLIERIPGVKPQHLRRP